MQRTQDSMPLHCAPKYPSILSHSLLVSSCLFQCLQSFQKSNISSTDHLYQSFLSSLCLHFFLLTPPHLPKVTQNCEAASCSSSPTWPWINPCCAELHAGSSRSIAQVTCTPNAVMQVTGVSCFQFPALSHLILPSL